ncbi:MAG TPA: HD domain-containing phosphohydrolase [Thermoanaerobaculia bacterium]|nr:HD domain-containing phosphohydrolase [Thermoanaerobaculia bacterium]
MQQEIEELRPKLKEILYDCAVEIRATKAALYLLNGEHYELVTEYGFRGVGVRPSADANHPIVDRCGRGRSAFFVNGVGVEPRFSQILFDASTDRMLVAPMYQRGKLVGFIDMRDKASKAPFDQTDIPKAHSIGERIVDLFANMNIFGHRYITLSKASGIHPAADAPLPGEPPAVVSQYGPVRDLPNVPTPTPATRPATAPQPVMREAPAPEPQPLKPAAKEPVRMPGLASLVIDARAIASRIVVAPAPPTIGEAELAAARDVLRSILLIPGSVAVTFSAFGHMGGIQEIAARSTLAEEAKNLIQSKLNVWLTRRGESSGFLKTNVSTPMGTSTPTLTAADVQKVFTAPLHVGSLRGLYLTVIFGSNPERSAHDMLAVLHSHLQLVLEQSLQRNEIATMQTRIAEKLLEPDFAKLPQLRRHSELVSKLAEQFARFLSLSPHEVDQARLVALVHDCGLRLLDYDRLYRKADLSTEEIAFLREHPSVGAAIVEPLLGEEIARAVLCHHERVDGNGYPNNLAGEEIPLVSRIVQLCDAWIAITDSESYQPAESHEAALATITRAAGSQFDLKLSGKFIEMLQAERRRP